MIKSFLSISARKGVKSGPFGFTLFENGFVWPVDTEKSVKTLQATFSQN